MTLQHSDVTVAVAVAVAVVAVMDGTEYEERVVLTVLELVDCDSLVVEAGGDGGGGCGGRDCGNKNATTELSYSICNTVGITSMVLSHGAAFHTTWTPIWCGSPCRSFTKNVQLVHPRL